MVTALFGDDSFLVEEAVLAAKSSYEHWILLEDQFDLSHLSDALQNLSLFFTPNILILNPWFLTKAVEEEALTQLQSLLLMAHTQQDQDVLIACTGKVDQRKKLAVWLKKNIQVQTFTGFKDWEEDKVISWLQQRAKRQSKRLSAQASALLFSLGGTNLRFLAAELDKLAVYVGESPEITPEAIHTVSLGTSGRIFQLTESLKLRDLPGALQSLARLFDAQEDPIKLLGLIASSLRLYTHICLGLSEGLTVQTLATKTGKNPYFLKQLVPTIQKKYRIEQLQSLYSLLCSCDLGIKTGKLSPKPAIESLVIKICSPS